MTVSRREFFKVGGLSIGAFGFAKNLFSKAPGTAKFELENMVRGVKPLTREDYGLRLEKAKRLMSDHGIDGLLLTGSTNLMYFMNVRWGGANGPSAPC